MILEGFGASLVVLSLVVVFYYYKIYENFVKHPEISSRLVFLNENVSKAFLVLALASFLYVAILGLLVFDFYFDLFQANLESLVLVLLLSQIFNFLSTIYWQRIIYTASSKHSDRRKNNS